jgi:hypothetical protein
METTEKIVESYCRYIRNWLTVPNIKCGGQYEVDLLAVDVSADSIQRFHLECGVSISGGYSKLTAKAFSPELLKERIHKAGQRRTIGYFIDHKFRNPHVLERLREYGFIEGNYRQIVVSWGATPDAIEVADREGIEVWDFGARQGSCRLGHAANG